MKISEYGLAPVKIRKTDEIFKAQKHLIDSGQLIQFASGVFGLNVVPKKALENTVRLIKYVMDKYGLIEVELPLIQPKEIWEASNRYKDYTESETMLVTQTNQGEFCLAPTAEEAVVELARYNLFSHKELPVTYYQIGPKFRNEIRNRGFMFRGKSFLMFDGYSFAKDTSSSEKIYMDIKKAYYEIFELLGLPVMAIAADPGQIGGSMSEEFMLLSPLGEDTILYDEKTKVGLNTEILEYPNYEEILKEKYGIEDISTFKKVRSVELGHIFNLGKKYSESMNYTFTDENEEKQFFEMGCYGIGVTRLIACIYEYFALKDDDGNLVSLNLPEIIAPYLVQIVATEDKKEFAEDLYNDLEKKNIPSILDDRYSKISLGAKINEVKTFGTPYLAILGDQNDDKIELENIKTGEKQILSKNDFIEFFEKINNSRNY